MCQKEDNGIIVLLYFVVKKKEIGKHYMRLLLEKLKLEPKFIGMNGLCKR